MCLTIFSKKNKTPGNDGLTIEFYVAFWSLIGKPLVDCINYSYKFGELSSSQKQVIITLIEKKKERIKEKLKIGGLYR